MVGGHERLRWVRSLRRLRSLAVSDKGVQLVEAAMVMPIVLAIMMGIVSSGVAVNHNISMNNGARETARFGATLPVDGDMQNWLTTLADVAMRSATGSMADGEPGRTICVSYVHPDGVVGGDRTTTLIVGPTQVRTTTSAPCYRDGRANSERRVQVRMQRQVELVLPSPSLTLTLNSHSTSHFERSR